ncbi:MAG: alpha/beta hydrolase [Anaerolineales bacterium]|nr:alpha/beta hydrolase [Anaerolineales bacterium]
MTWQKKWIEVRGHRIYLERCDRENSPLVVLLHHGLGSVQAWQSQMDVIARSGISVLAYDRWGYGRSDDRSRLDPPFFWEDVRDLEEILGSESKPLIIIGHSDGGNIALTFASNHSENLLGVIVIAAHIYFEPKMAQGIQELLRAFQENKSFRSGLQSIHGGKPVFERWFHAWSQSGMDWDLRPAFSSISCPVLVLQGSEDEHASVKHAVDLAAALPKGRVRILEGITHMLPQKFCDIFNQILFEALLDFQRVDQYVQ